MRMQPAVGNCPPRGCHAAAVGNCAPRGHVPPWGSGRGCHATAVGNCPANHGSSPTATRNLTGPGVSHATTLGTWFGLTVCKSGRLREGKSRTPGILKIVELRLGNRDAVLHCSLKFTVIHGCKNAAPFPHVGNASAPASAKRCVLSEVRFEFSFLIHFEWNQPR
jgi:hypothetical protein